MSLFNDSGFNKFCGLPVEIDINWHAAAEFACADPAALINVSLELVLA